MGMLWQHGGDARAVRRGRGVPSPGDVGSPCAWHRRCLPPVRSAREPRGTWARPRPGDTEEGWGAGPRGGTVRAAFSPGATGGSCVCSAPAQRGWGAPGAGPSHPKSHPVPALRAVPGCGVVSSSGYGAASPGTEGPQRSRGRGTRDSISSETSLSPMELPRKQDRHSSLSWCPPGPSSGRGHSGRSRGSDATPLRASSIPGAWAASRVCGGVGKRRLWKAWEGSGNSPLRLETKPARLEPPRSPPGPAGLCRSRAPPPGLPRSEQGAGRFILGEGMSFRY